MSVGGVSVGLLPTRSVVQNNRYAYWWISGSVATAWSSIVALMFSIYAYVAAWFSRFRSPSAADLREGAQHESSALQQGMLCQSQPLPEPLRVTERLRLQPSNFQQRKNAIDYVLGKIYKKYGVVPNAHAPGISRAPTLEADVRNLLKEVVFYPPSDFISESRVMHANALLSRGAAIAVPMVMDYCAQWQLDPNTSKRFFTALHGVAINLRSGSENDRVSEEERSAHLTGMRQIMLQLLRVQRDVLQQRQGSSPDGTRQEKHAVWVPFGMGAFLRGVKDCKQRQEIAQDIAGELMRLLDAEAPSSKIIVHVCLPSSGDEARRNYDAFWRAFLNLSSRASHYIVLEENVDAAARAQDLANDEGKVVVLVIAGNPKQLGNHWFNPNSASRAMEENVYRRSSILAELGYLLNGCISEGGGLSGPGLLASRTLQLGGQVCYLDKS